MGGKCAQASEGFLDASLQPPKDKTQLEGNPLFFTEYTRKKSQVAIYILSGHICAKQPSQSCFQDEGIEIHCIKKNVSSFSSFVNGSSVQGILQARILERVAIFSSRGSSGPRDQTGVSCIDRQIL